MSCLIRTLCRKSLLSLGVVLVGLFSVSKAFAGTGYIDNTGRWNFSVLFVEPAPNIINTAAWQTVFNQANNYLYQSSNGKFRFGTIRMISRVCTEASPEVCYDPLVDVIIYADETITNADVYGAGRLGYHIFLANALLTTSPPITDYVPRTFVHELGHYLFSLLDEYRNRAVPNPMPLLHCIYPAFSDSTLDAAACFMEDLDANVGSWCYVDNHEAETDETQHGETWQSLDNDLLSCWSTMKRVYEGRSFFGATDIPNDPAFPLTAPANPTYISGQPLNELVVAVDANMSSTEEADMYLMLDALFARNPGPNSFVTFLSYHSPAMISSSQIPWDTSLVALQGGVPQYRNILSGIRPTTRIPNAALQTLLSTALGQFSASADSRTLLILTSGTESPVLSPPSGFFTSFLQIRTSIGFVKPMSSFSASDPIIITYTDLADSIAGRVYDVTAENVIAYQAVESARKQLVCVETKLVAGGKTDSLEFTLTGPIKDAMISASWRPTNNNCDARVSFKLTPDPGQDFIGIDLPALQARRYFNLPAGTTVEIFATTPDTCQPPPLPVTFAISDERPTVFLTVTPERPRYGTDDNQVIHARVTNPHPLINVNMIANEIDSLGEFRTNPDPVALADTGASVLRYGDWVEDDGIYSLGFKNLTATGLRTLRVRATSTAQTKLAPGERFSNEPSNKAIPGFRREAFVTFFVPPVQTTLSQSTRIDVVKRMNPAKDTVLVAGHFNLPPNYPHLFDITGNVMPSGGAKAPMKIDANHFTAKILVSPAVTAVPLTVETNFLYRTNDLFPDKFTGDFTITGITAEPKDGDLLLQKFRLHPNYPNPFNLGTRLAFDLPKRSKISLGIYDVMGRQIRTLIADEIFTAGTHQMEWDGRTDDGKVAGSGVYFVRLRAANQQWVHKILLMK